MAIYPSSYSARMRSLRGLEMGWNVSEEVRPVVVIRVNQPEPLGSTDTVYLMIDVVIDACHVVFFTEVHFCRTVLSDADRVILIRLVARLTRRSGRT